MKKPSPRHVFVPHLLPCYMLTTLCDTNSKKQIIHRQQPNWKVSQNVPVWKVSHFHEIFVSFRRSKRSLKYYSLFIISYRTLKPIFYWHSESYLGLVNCCSSATIGVRANCVSSSEMQFPRVPTHSVSLSVISINYVYYECKLWFW